MLRIGEVPVVLISRMILGLCFHFALFDFALIDFALFLRQHFNNLHCCGNGHVKLPEHCSVHMCLCPCSIAGRILGFEIFTVHFHLGSCVTCLLSLRLCVYVVPRQLPTLHSEASQLNTSFWTAISVACALFKLALTPSCFTSHGPRT